MTDVTIRLTLPASVVSELRAAGDVHEQLVEAITERLRELRFRQKIAAVEKRNRPAWMDGPAVEALAEMRRKDARWDRRSA